MTVNLSCQATLVPPNADPYVHFASSFANITAQTRYDPRSLSNRHGEAGFSAQKSSMFPGDTGSRAGDYTLSFTVEVQDGDQFYFSAYAGRVGSIIAVPVPPGARLFLVGRPAVLAAVRRRRG